MRIWIENFRTALQHPWRVALLTLIVVGGLMLLDGTLYRIWALNRDAQQLSERIAQLQARVADHQRQLKAVQNPVYIEKMARERLDLVREGDLIFIFSGSEVPIPAATNATSQSRSTSPSTRASR
ncbi:MAG TPA: septum formation initiator family protein [Pseudobdellovibrionaceae bacterium]|nr:septum formation initiator family protein [Pseudobdellovibrionaceae bacterium]